jgi:uncharacterized damage-inducible protein DinB
MSDPKEDLHRYLLAGREALLWKLEGLSEREVRRPVTPMGTNLLGVVKHVAGVEAGYLGDCFGRPFPEPLPWMAPDAEPNADMWAGPDETRASVLALFARTAAHGDATIEALPLDARGAVPWWAPETREVTLHRILVHLISDVQRHAGHADVVRELIDGSAGLRADNDNLPDDLDWPAYVARLQRVADEAG